MEKSNEKASITKKQQLILTYLFDFPFLTRIHIQKLLHHKNHKLILLWLNDLVVKKYVGKIYTKQHRGNILPSIYYLTPQGTRFISKQFVEISHAAKKRIREESVSQFTMQHTFLTADIFLVLRTFAKETITFLSKRNLPEEIHTITPDAFFTHKTDEGIKAYFLEVDRETEIKAKMQRKLQRYFEYYHSYSWKKLANEYFPAILFVSLTEERTIWLKKMIEHIMNENKYPPLVFKLTTWEKLQKNGCDIPVCFVPFKKSFYSFL